MFVGGKGGVGKTTCAAMFALDASRRGATLLVTTDPASSLADVLDASVGPDGSPVRAAANLQAAHVDASRAFARWLAPRKPLLATIAVRGTYLDEEDVARLLKLSLPGIDEVVGLLEITRMVRESREPYATVVVDTAPTGHTLRLLAAPALLGRVAGLLDSLQAHHRAVVSALRGSYSTDAADTLIAELERDGRSLSTLLRDRGTTRVVWVTLPEPMALEETSDAIEALESQAIAVATLIVNRMGLPPAEPCTWCEARRRFEARALAPLARRFGGREILALPELPREPRGAAALRKGAALLTTWHPPADNPPVATRVRTALNRASIRDFDRGGRSARVARAHLSSKAIDDVVGSARWLLFGGKGGVGKSTCAAAAALHLAATRRVLLLSTDPAHSLGDTFGAALDNTPRRVPGGPSRLLVREIDAAAEMDRFRRKYVAAVDEAFSRIARTAAGDRAAIRDLIDLAPPGIDEVIAVADVAEAVAGGKGDYDVVVTDTAPTGHALRLLQTPAVLRDWTLALMAILLKYREIVGAGTLAGLLVQLSKRLRRLQDILADATETGFIVVTRAAIGPVLESRRLIDSLAPMGIGVRAVIVNAGGAGECGRCRGAARQQARAIGLLRQSLGRAAYAIIEAPAEVPPPHGVIALTDWGLAWRRLT